MVSAPGPRATQDAIGRARKSVGRGAHSRPSVRDPAAAPARAARGCGRGICPRPSARPPPSQQRAAPTARGGSGPGFGRAATHSTAPTPGRPSALGAVRCDRDRGRALEPWRAGVRSWCRVGRGCQQKRGDNLHAARGREGAPDETAPWPLPEGSSSLVQSAGGVRGACPAHPSRVGAACPQGSPALPSPHPGSSSFPAGPRVRRGWERPAEARPCPSLWVRGRARVAVESAPARGRQPLPCSPAPWKGAPFALHL